MSARFTMLVGRYERRTARAAGSGSSRFGRHPQLEARRPTMPTTFATVGVWSYGLAAAGFAVFLAVLAVGRRLPAQPRTLLAAVAASVAWAVAGVVFAMGGGATWWIAQRPARSPAGRPVARSARDVLRIVCRRRASRLVVALPRFPVAGRARVWSPRQRRSRCPRPASRWRRSREKAPGSRGSSRSSASRSSASRSSSICSATHPSRSAGA